MQEQNEVEALREENMRLKNMLNIATQDANAFKRELRTIIAESVRNKMENEIRQKIQSAKTVDTLKEVK